MSKTPVPEIIPKLEYFVLIHQAQQVLEQGYADLSLHFCSLAIQLQPDNIEAYASATIAALAAGRFDQALEMSRQGFTVSDFTNDTDPLTRGVKWALSQARANALIEVGRYDEAIQVAQLSYKANPTPKAQIELANTLALCGHLDEAKEHYGAGLQQLTDPQKATITYSNMAKMLEQRSQFVEALKYFKKAVSVCPTNSQARIELARALRERGLPLKAVAHLKHVTTTDLNYGEAAQEADLAGHADYQMTEVFPDEEAELKGPIPEGQPASMYRDLADLHMNCLATVNAILALKAGLRTEPTKLSLILLLADLLVQKRLLPSVEPLVTTGLQHYPDHPQLHALRTLLTSSRHDRQKTFQAYTRTKELLDTTTEFATEDWEHTIEANLYLPSRRKCNEYLILAFGAIKEWQSAVDHLFDTHRFIIDSSISKRRSMAEEEHNQTPVDENGAEEAIRAVVDEQATRCQELLRGLTKNVTNAAEAANADSLAALLCFLVQQADETTEQSLFWAISGASYEASHPLIDAICHYHPNSFDLVNKVNLLREHYDPNHTNPDWICLRRPALNIIRQEIH